MRAMSVAAAMLVGSAWAVPGEAAPAEPVRVPAAERPMPTPRTASVLPAERERGRGVERGTFLRPEVRPTTRQRPSDYYQPPAREAEPFYHYRRSTPPLTAPAYQRHHR